MANTWYSFGMGKPKNSTTDKNHKEFPQATDKKDENEPYYVEEEMMKTPASDTQPIPEKLPETSPEVVEKLVCENGVVIHETDRIINALRQSIENQQAIYSLLEDQLRVSNEQLRVAKEENARLTDIVRKQHETLSKFQNDVFYRSQKDVIMEIIRIADEVETIKETTGKDSIIEADLKSLAKFIDDSLVFSAVKSFRDADGVTKEVNLKKQEMSEVVIPTDQPEKDGVLVSLRPGYIWRLPWLVANTDVQLTKIIKENNAPRTYEVVIRPELIGVMRYEAPTLTPDSHDDDTTSEEPINQPE